jgi:hypothetical protein
MLDPPLDQRVAVRVRLSSFDRDATEAYIKHRLRLAGAQRMLFAPEAIDIIHDRARGIPRVINTLCDNALFEAFLARQRGIDGETMRKIAENLDLTVNAAADGKSPVEGAAGEIALPRRRKVDLASIDAMLAGLQKS